MNGKIIIYVFIINTISLYNLKSVRYSDNRIIYETIPQTSLPIASGYITRGVFYILVVWFYSSNINGMLMLLFFLICGFFWYLWGLTLDNYSGIQSFLLVDCIKYGICTFILSEVLFFFGFFWSNLHIRANILGTFGLDVIDGGNLAFETFSVPLLNTILLVSSSWTLTISHINTYVDGLIGFSGWTLITLFLGVIFLYCQFKEYIDLNGCISDIYIGSVFYLGTGFHILHVLIGTVFICRSSLHIICNRRIFFDYIGFEFSVWYWHFVDVVWLLLFCIFYISMTI